MTLRYSKEGVEEFTHNKRISALEKCFAADWLTLHAENEAKDRRIARIETVRDALRERQRVYQAREDAHREAGELGQAQRLGALRRECQEIADVLDSVLAPESPKATSSQE